MTKTERRYRRFITGLTNLIFIAMSTSLLLWASSCGSVAEPGGMSWHEQDAADTVELLTGYSNVTADEVTSGLYSFEGSKTSDMVVVTCWGLFSQNGENPGLSDVRCEDE